MKKKWPFYVRHFFTIRSYENKKFFHLRRLNKLREFLIYRQKWEKPGGDKMKYIIKKKLKYLSIETTYKKIKI